MKPRTLASGLFPLLLAGGALHAQVVQSVMKVSSTQSGSNCPPACFQGPLHDGDEFGAAAYPALGLGPFAVLLGAPGDDDAGLDSGAFYMVEFGGPGPTLEIKVGGALGGSLAGLAPGDRFGSALSEDMGWYGVFAGAPGDDGGGVDRGALWWVELPDGVLGRAARYAESSGGFPGTLHDGDEFGASVCLLADFWFGWGELALAVGAPGTDGGGFDRGAVWILRFDPNHLPLTIVDAVEIGSSAGGLGDILRDGDRFGSAVQGWSNLQGYHLAVGAPGDDDGGPDRGAVYVLDLNDDHTVRSSTKLSDTTGFPGVLRDGDAFGAGVGFTWLGQPSVAAAYAGLAVGAPGRDGPGVDRGAAWLLELDPDYAILWQREISEAAGNLPTLHDGDRFGSSISGRMDGNISGPPLNGDFDMAFGAPGDDDGGPDRGAVWGLGIVEAPLVRFQPDPRVGLVPLSVAFTNQTQNGPFSWDWDFGDGSTSTVQNPTHVYTNPGRYDVSLATTGAEGLVGGVRCTGCIRAQDFAASATPFGCNGGSYSLQPSSGSNAPEIGKRLALYLSNPFGTQSAGTLPFLALSARADPAYPCGTALPGFGMQGPTGVLLLDVSSGSLLQPILAGPALSNPKSSSRIDLSIPNEPALSGTRLFAQALFVDPFGPVHFGLTTGLDLLIGW